MSPMFGHKDEEKQDKGHDKDEANEQWRRALRTEFERLISLSMIDLAAEVMIKGFGPGSPGADDDAISLGQQNRNAGPTAADIAAPYGPGRIPSGNPTADDFKIIEGFRKLVAEGLQELEHASLVRVQIHTEMGYLDWAATRRGRAALESNEVQSILHAANSPSA